MNNENSINVENFIGKYPDEFEELVNVFRKFNQNQKTQVQENKKEVEINNFIETLKAEDSDLASLSFDELQKLIQDIKNLILECLNLTPEEIKAKIQKKANKKKKEIKALLEAKKKEKQILSENEINNLLNQMNCKDLQSLDPEIKNLINEIKEEREQEKKEITEEKIEPKIIIKEQLIEKVENSLLTVLSGIDTDKNENKKSFLFDMPNTKQKNNAKTL